LRRARAGAALALALALGGCGKQSTLDPESHPAREIATLWWGMLAAATVVFVGAVALLVIAAIRRETPGLPLLGERENAATGLVLVFGIAIPAVVLITLFGLANIGVLKATEAPKASTTRMTVEVIGHQWFWEVRYPGTAAVTANEIHIPARTRVNLVAKTADVIHSFWVPQLNRKIDMVPGHPNRILLYADKRGRYRGQCAEFCGPQHAHMANYVFADPPAKFSAWLRNMASPRRKPTAPIARRGERVFLTNQCASCHTIRGTPAKGAIGPDLTHLASRTTLAALAIPNNTAQLGTWIADPQHIKPGNKMPGLALRPTEFQDLLAYLETLK
jgi:cytochrome c oxidase subunit II